MDVSVLMLNIFIITSTAMYADTEFSHNYLAGSSQSGMQITDNLRVGKIINIRSRNQDINNQAKAMLTKSIQTENTGKDITNVFFKFPNLRNPFKNFKIPPPPSIFHILRICPKGKIWLSNRCVSLHARDSW